MGDTRYVPWAEWGNRGTASQVTVFGGWDEELDPRDWWVVSQGSNGEGGEKGKKGKKRKREKEGGTFRVLGELLFRNREEAEAHLREALKEGDDGDNGDDGDDQGDQGDDKGEGGDKGGEVGGAKGGEKEGDTEGEKGGAGQRCAPATPHHAREVTCVSRLAKGGRGDRGSNRAHRANRANPPPSDSVPARQVTFQVTYGVG